MALQTEKTPTAAAAATTRTKRLPTIRRACSMTYLSMLRVSKCLAALPLIAAPSLLQLPESTLQVNALPSVPHLQVAAFLVESRSSQ